MVILFLSRQKRETGQFWNCFSKNGVDLIIIMKKGAVLAILPSMKTMRPDKGREKTCEF